MLRVSQLRGFNRTPQPANMKTQALTVALGAASSAWNAYTVRMFIQPTAFAAGTPALVQFIRCTLGAPNIGDSGINPIFVGVGAPGSPTPTNLNAQNLVPLTVGGAAGFNILASRIVTTDIAQFLWDRGSGTTPLVISWYFAGAGNLAYQGGLTFPANFWYTNANQAGQLIVSGTWTQGGNPPQMGLVSVIDLG